MRGSLAQQIAAQVRVVEEADHRLALRVAAAKNTLVHRRSPLRSLALSAAPAVAAWFFLRRGRRPSVPGSAGGASGAGRLPLLLNAVLPILVPAIGMRAAALLSALAAVPAATAARAPAITQPIDLARFAGTWFEIGRLPARHERQCADDVTATYLLDRSHIDVVNQCRRAHGRLDTVRGRARVVDPVSRAKLRVTFAPALLRWLPGAWADYWILDVSPGYRRALVGTPDRKSLWILAREPSIPETEYHALLLQAAAQGYETQRMQRTTHRSLR